MTTVAEALTMALQHHHTGNLQQAETLYRQILQVEPQQPVAMHFLGLIAHQVGRHDIAIDYMSRSIALMPQNEGFYSNLALAYQALGRLDEAAACFRKALQIRPNFTDALNNLANVLADQGKVDEAIAGYKAALARSPNSAEAHTNIGVAYQRIGKMEEAETHCRKAVRLKPDSPEARTNLGNVQTARGKLEEAELNYREAARLKPSYAVAFNNLGGTLQLQGKLVEAIASYREAIRCKPDYAEAHGNLATALQVQGNLEEAETHLRQALQFMPTMSASHNNLGGVLQLQGKFAEAVACFREALRLSPGDVSAHSNILLCMNYDPTTAAESLFEEHRQWGICFGQATGGGPAPGHDRNPDRRLRVGYVSPDLSMHPIAHFLQPILANHDPNKFEAICYADVSAPDAMTARLKTLSHGWRSITGLNDVEIADLVRTDAIDILVDLAGHTAKSRLRFFAHKPAPVQVTYLGYPYTTGMKAVDYRLTDAVADPPGETIQHTEELIRLPQGFCCYTPPASAPEPGPLPSQHNGYVTFGSLHALHRLNSQVLDLWCSILRAVPTAHLLVFRHTLQGKTEASLRQQLVDRGIEVSRFELASKVEGDGGFLSVYRRVDISLDTFPWSGHTTSCESLWMGVPVITLRGTRHAGRMVASVLTHIGLPELVADTPEQYRQLAVDLARDTERLGKLRSELREKVRNSPLCDGKGFTQSLEAAYREMWHRWCGVSAAAPAC